MYLFFIQIPEHAALHINWMHIIQVQERDRQKLVYKWLRNITNSATILSETIDSVKWRIDRYRLASCSLFMSLCIQISQLLLIAPAFRMTHLLISLAGPVISSLLQTYVSIIILISTGHNLSRGKNSCSLKSSCPPTEPPNLYSCSFCCHQGF